MWYKRFNLKHCSALEPQTTDLGPPATILTLVTVLTNQRIEHILSGPLVTILTNRHQGIVSICKLHSLHQNHIPSAANLDKGSGRMFRRQILGWVHKKTFFIPATKFRECAYCTSPDQTEGEKRVTRKLQISPLFSEIRTCPYISCLCIELYIASPPPPRPLLQYFPKREVQVSEGPIEQRSKHLRSTKPKRPEANIVPGPPYRQLGPEIGPSMTTAILRWVQRVQCHNMATITATYRRCPIGGEEGLRGIA